MKNECITGRTDSSTKIDVLWDRYYSLKKSS